MVCVINENICISQIRSTFDNWKQQSMYIYMTPQYITTAPPAANNTTQQKQQATDWSHAPLLHLTSRGKQTTTQQPANTHTHTHPRTHTHAQSQSNYEVKVAPIHRRNNSLSFLYFHLECYQAAGCKSYQEQLSPSLGLVQKSFNMIYLNNQTDWE